MALKSETEVLVVGTGPVGLFTALSLAERGIGVQVIDKEYRGSAHSYALALHPASLRLLDEYGAADELIDQGNRVERIAIYEGDSEVAAMDVAAMGGPYPFLLVVPQSALENALTERLKQKRVKVFWNHQCIGLEQGAGEVTARIGRMEKYSTGYPIAHTEWMLAKEYKVQAGFLIGADGYHSMVRKALDIEFELLSPGETFSVFEFSGELDFTREARLVFHGDTTNVVWPLGPGRGRWSFQVDGSSSAPPEPARLSELIDARASWFGPRIEGIHWTTTVLFERRLAKRFGDGRIWLAGDAAHITGPVGAQSMNVGLREAHDIAEMISAVQKSVGSLSALEEYQAARTAEWRRLLGLEGHPQPADESSKWTAEQAAQLLACVPASGEELQLLLGQIGLRWD